MQRRVKEMTFGGKPIEGIGSFSLRGYVPPFEELFEEAVEVEFSGIFNPIERKPDFEVGKIYDFTDRENGLKGKAKCTFIDGDGYRFKVIGHMEKIQ